MLLHKIRGKQMEGNGSSLSYILYQLQTRMPILGVSCFAKSGEDG